MHIFSEVKKNNSVICLCLARGSRRVLASYLKLVLTAVLLKWDRRPDLSFLS